jgi:hypothetical protein
VESPSGHELARLEKRIRTVTGLVLGAVAFLSAYGLMMYEGQIDRPAFLFYPWLLGVLFYLAGDLLGMVWFRVSTAQMRAMLDQQRKQDEARRLASLAGLLDEQPQAVEGVEVIRPSGTGGR